MEVIYPREEKRFIQTLTHVPVTVTFLQFMLRTFRLFRGNKLGGIEKYSFENKSLRSGWSPFISTRAV